MNFDVTFQEVSKGFSADFGLVVNQPCGVLYTPQNLTDTQKEQAKKNIGATINDVADKLCPSFTESGAVVVCEPFEGYPLSVVSHIAAVQGGSGDASPDNIRPITGYNAVNVWRGGKNLATNFSVNVQNGEFIGKAETLQQYVIFFADLKQGVTYTVSCNQVNDLTSAPPRNTWIVRYPDGTTAYNGTTKYETDFAKQYAGLHSITFTASITGRYQFDYWVHTFSNDVTFNNFQLEVSAVATAYEPYRGETFTIDLGQTVYSGYVDWNSGVLTVDRKLQTLNGSEFWGVVLDGGETADTIPNSVIFQTTTDSNNTKTSFADILCNKLNPNTANVWNRTASGIYMSKQSIRVFVEGIDYTVTGFKAWLAENPIEVVYPIEPTTIQLTPKEILALAGTNTIYSNTGITDVSGKADLTAIIENLTNAIIALGGNV